MPLLAEPPFAAALTVQQRRELVARVASSKTFQKSARQRDVLLYLCDRAISDPQIAIREQDIGSAVFGRSAGYDTGQDNIVRVHVSELRRRLERYFENEGATEEWTIDIPKGGYVPVFTVRHSPEVAASTALDIQPISSRPYWLYAVCLLLAAGCVWLILQNRKLSTEAAASTRPKVLDSLWSRLLVPGQRTDIVLADSNLSVLQDLTGEAVSLNDYLNHRYWSPSTAAGWSPERRRDLDILMARRYTSISDAEFVRQISSVNVPKSVRLSVFFARDYSLQDLQSNNVILVGSSRSNPWVELFADRLSFQFEADPKTGIPRYRIRDPRPGEQSVYNLKDQEPDKDAYGAVAFLPNLSRTGNVLLISGTGIQAIRTGGEFVTDEELIKTLSMPQSPLPYFEVLYRTQRIGGAARGFEKVADRIHTSDSRR